jgi:prepilin-type N-terminal cleavage/methylation domain-containing protein
MLRPVASLSQGFTLLELLVTVVVIGALASALMIYSQGADEKARLASLQNDLRSYALAQEMRLADTDRFAPHPDSMAGYSLPRGVRVVSAAASGAGAWHLVLQHRNGERCGQVGGPRAERDPASSSWCSVLNGPGLHDYSFEGGTLAGFDSWSERSWALEPTVPGSLTPDGDPSVMATGEHWIEGNQLLPYEAGRTYTVSAWFRNVGAGSAGTSVIYAGLLGYEADGVTPINQRGDATRGCAHYVPKSAQALELGSDWVKLEGSFSGWGKTNPCGVTSVLRAGVAYVRPVVLVNYRGRLNKTEVGSLRVQVK